MTRRNTLITSLSALSLLIAGCATTPPATTEGGSSPEAAAAAPAAEMPACALELPGTTVDLGDLEAGISVNFHSAGDAAAILALQERVEARLAFMQANPKPTPFEMGRRSERSEDGISMIVEVTDLANAPKVRGMVGKKIAAAQAKVAAASEE